MMKLEGWDQKIDPGKCAEPHSLSPLYRVSFEFPGYYESLLCFDYLLYC